ncbi:hypothetical protein AAC387_Pa04g1729 [Persea americana]
MDLFSPIVEVVKLLCVPLVQQIAYLRDLEENMNVLRNKIDELSSRENDLTTELNRAKLQGWNPKDEVNNWLKNVNEAKNQVTGIQREFGENRKCLKGCLPNYCSRWKLSRRSLKLIAAVDELTKKSSFDAGVAVAPLPATAHLIPTTSLVGTSAERTFKRIWDCLMDEEIVSIGIYGMGGVGKTTIMKNVNNCLRDAKRFNIVIKVNVSKHFNLKKLQSDIAEQVGLDLPESHDEESRSTQLYRALLQQKNFLLILDDMWDRFSLEDVGIPKPTVDNGCKVVAVSRSHGLCRMMEMQINIKVDVLSEDEAWTLFQEKVGKNVFLTSYIEDVAKLVAKECGGLPLAIITVGRALRDVTDIREWENALYQLRRSIPGIEGMENDVFKKLKFSYDHLENEKIRSCFLYCSLFPEDCEINANVLVELWIWEGLIDEMENKQAEVNHGQVILNKLKRCCMLESGDSEDVETIKMHDLMRDLAIIITRHSPHFMVKAGIGLKEPPPDWEWVENVERISLMANEIEILSCQPNCPELLTLILRENPLSQITPHSFFCHMHKLVVLDLSRTHIEMVPESLSNLVNLHALILVNCWKLKKIPDVGKLKELRVLNLRYSSIEELPEGMERLRKLRILDLSSTEKLERFPVGILPKLSLLEELSMLGSSCLWSSNEAEMMRRRIQIEEITGLTRLTSVNLDFSDTPSFSWYVRSLQHRVLRLKSFCLRVVNADIVALSRQNRIQIRGCDFFSRLNIFFLLLEDTCCLEFVECEKCNGMECLIVAQDDKSNSLLLPRVNRLNIANMPDLEVLYRGPMVHGTFKTLRILEISGCPKLKNLFPRRFLRSLQSLESIEIDDCKIMEELVEEDDGCTNDERGKGNTVDDDHVIKLLGLKSLRLWSLPSLKNICNKTLECNSLIHIHIRECPHLSKLPLFINKPSSDFKGHLEGKRQWWDALEWVDPGTKALFHPFFIDEEESD